MLKRWQLRLYECLWALMLAAGLAGIMRLWASLGRGFGGFIWQYDNNVGHSVSFDVPRHWPGPQAGLTPHTRITAIDGRSPWEFPHVYAETPIGTPVVYDVIRTDGQTARISVPVVRFTPSYLADGYGMVFAIGLTFSSAGYVLLRSARDTGRSLLAFVMLAGADAALYHGHNGNIDRFYNRPIFAALMGAPSNGILGALLLHLALVYPRRVAIASRHPWLIPGSYALGGGISTILGASIYYGSERRFARMQPPAQLASIAFLVAGVAATLLRGAWELSKQHEGASAAERRQIRIMAVAWTLAATVLLGIIGAANLRVAAPFELLTALGVALPIGLVYAIFNADLIADLEEQSELRGQLLAQLDELQRLRERMLDDLADELHDTALADSKVLELRLYTLLRQTTEGRIEGGQLREALADLHSQGVALGRGLRQTVERVKPIDFGSESLGGALESLVAQLNAAQTTRYMLVLRGPIEEVSLSLKETIYGIARAALNNVREHAAAEHCTIELVSASDSITLTVGDNGRGSTSASEAGHRRRQLGLPSMRARAARFGGHLDVSIDRQGTRIMVRFPCQR
jgi:signal transduction histidine kinase